jgi:hypothetical protein
LSCIPLRYTREPVLLWLHHEYTYIHITCSAGWGLTLTVLDMNFCYYLLGLFFPFCWAVHHNHIPLEFVRM